jgi:hypothetical protein
MGQAVGDGGLRVREPLRSVHGLEQQAIEAQVLVAGRVDARLREDELEFRPGGLGQRLIALRADADPVETGGRGQGAVALHRHLEAAGVEGGDQGRVELQQGLAPGADHQLGLLRRTAPERQGGRGQGVRVGEPAAVLAVHADEVGVAEGAGGSRPVLLAS